MKDWILMFTVVVVVIGTSLAMIRWLAPSLLGVPTDLQLVQVDEKVPPFYENIFRIEDHRGDSLLLQDPLTRIRSRPLLLRDAYLGPHDILGFRNPSVPNVADVVTIGDSMTYGNNARMENNWPGVMADALGAGRATVYNMGAGGWGAVQYLDMFSNATLLRPRVIVVAFYTGNDPLDSFMMAYSGRRWSALVPDTGLDSSDAPPVEFPAPQSEWWPVTFSDGVKTVFTPELRLASNQEHPAVDAGYEIMARVMETMVDMSRELPLRLVATIIPTKELVYANRVAKEGIEAPAAYRQLVEREAANMRHLGDRIAGIQGLEYVDVLEPLQTAADSSLLLYPDDVNGHPADAGYAVIGKTIARKVDGLLPPRLRGRVAYREGDTYKILLVSDDGYRYFSSLEIMQQNGWPEGEVPPVTRRDLAGIPYRGVVSTVNPARFGPQHSDR